MSWAGAGFPRVAARVAARRGGEHRAGPARGGGPGGSRKDPERPAEGMADAGSGHGQTAGPDPWRGAFLGENYRLRLVIKNPVSLRAVAISGQQSVTCSV